MEAGCQFGEEVAVLTGCGLGVGMQLGDLAGEQCVPLGLERGDVPLSVLDLARDAEKLGHRAFASDGGVDLTMVVEAAAASRYRRGYRPDWREPSAG